MFGKLSSKALMAFAVILVMAAGPPCTGQTACTYYNKDTNPGGVRGGGIFVQMGTYHSTTLTVVNLTSFPLTSVPVVMVNSTHGEYPFQNMVDSNRSLVVDLSRSKTWKGASNDWDVSGAHYNNPKYEGIMQWEVRDASGTLKATFEVDFAAQNDGTWVWLHGRGWNGWCAPGAASAACGGIYRTESMYRESEDPLGTGTGSLQMHNIMTLGNAQFAVALYGLTDDEHMVLVIREVMPGDDYYAFNLDWVDQTASVPGGCNN